ncbi:hypothetical protein JB92DRAFT_2838439 [Gautieria morchelliformis]|nr:hypothetical protein JB92DRAFT_2838439 [Gautieria morchelliformis]
MSHDLGQPSSKPLPASSKRSSVPGSLGILGDAIVNLETLSPHWMMTIQMVLESEGLVEWDDEIWRMMKRRLRQRSRMTQHSCSSSKHVQDAHASTAAAEIEKEAGRKRKKHTGLPNDANANRSTRFIDAYQKGLTGSQAVWANRHYHGHRILPGTILEELEKAGKK